MKEESSNKPERLKVEVMIVDDELDWLDIFRNALSDMGYCLTTAHSSYDAINQIAIRLHEGSELPDIYLCDMLDRRYTIAKIEERRYAETSMRTIYPSIAFNLHNYLKSMNMKPDFFIGHTCNISREDRATAYDLEIPLIEKNNTCGCFPDINGFDREDGLKKFKEIYDKSLKPDYTHSIPGVQFND